MAVTPEFCNQKNEKTFRNVSKKRLQSKFDYTPLKRFNCRTLYIRQTDRHYLKNYFFGLR